MYRQINIICSISLFAHSTKNYNTVIEYMVVLMKKKINLGDKKWIHLLVPWVRLTSVLPTSRFVNMHGARTLYQSLRVNGSILNTKNNKINWCSILGKCFIIGTSPCSVRYTHIFFFKPFLPPLDRPLFLPTAMMN